MERPDSTLDRTNDRRHAGHTLVEMVVAAGILTVVAGGLFTMMRESQDVFCTIVRTVQARHDCSAALKGIGHDVELASNAVMTVDATAADGDLIKFQTPLAVANGVITWGAREGAGAQHVDYNGAFVEYFVAVNPNRHPQRSLVRRIVDNTGKLLVSDTIVVDGVDSPSATLGKGFKIVRNQRQVTLTARTRNSTDKNETDRGKDLIKSQQITVRLRNP